MLDEERQAAIFDFDGVIFQATTSWKIKSPRVGVLGARIPWSEANDLYTNIREQFPEMAITDCFALDEYGYDSVDPDEHINLVPPSTVMKTAQNHRFKGHDLYLLSQSEHSDLLTVTDSLMGPPKYPVLKNPFGEASFLSTRSKERIEPDSGINEKIDLITSHLLKTDSRRLNRTGTEPVLYQKIFLYFTERSYKSAVDRYIGENIERLEGGRNAIVYMYVADLNP